MDKKRRLIELIKDALILLLSCSALWLAARTPLADPLWDLFREEGPQVIRGRDQVGGLDSGVLPMAMSANLPGGIGSPEGSEGVRYGICYDQTACQELFQKVAGSLAETLSSSGAPEEVDRGEWEAALTARLGIYMDFQGEVPLPVLVGWLSGGETELTATVRRLVLTQWEGGTDVYYLNEEDGGFYRCRSEVADSFSLAEALSGLTDNGAFFAFESELYAGLAPDTLLLPDAPAPAVYNAANPMNAGQGALESLVQDLGFSLNSTSFYSTDEQVARSGDDSVRLSGRGVAQYQYEGRAGDGLFPILRQGEGNDLFDRVETCRQIALSAMGGRCGEARLYLQSVTERSGGLEIDFGYSLNGVPVLLDWGCAARFLVEGDQVVQFSVCLRSYTAAGESGLVLPPRQGTAALLARGLEGEELLLTYADSGGDTLSAGWSARGDRRD